MLARSGPCTGPAREPRQQRALDLLLQIEHRDRSDRARARGGKLPASRQVARVESLVAPAPQRDGNDAVARRDACATSAANGFLGDPVDRDAGPMSPDDRARSASACTMSPSDEGRMISARLIGYASCGSRQAMPPVRDAAGRRMDCRCVARRMGRALRRMSHRRRSPAPTPDAMSDLQPRLPLPEFSLVVITRDAGAQLAACLDSARFAAETLVVDSGSQR